MTEFFEAFNPAARHLREQKDLEKVWVAPRRVTGRGPQPLDLDSGRIVLVRPGEPVAAEGPVVRVATDKDLPRAGRVAVRAYLDGSDLKHTDPYLDVVRDAAGRARHAEVWVAEAGGVVAGTVTWCPPGSALREAASDDEGEFRILAVDPAVQGQGLGRMLVEAMVVRAREAGLRGLTLSSADWMTRAHGLYRSMGFERLPERDSSPRPDVHLVVFRLAL